MSEFNQIVNDFFKNYHDRGMKKWAGFYLSDHTQRIEKEQKEQNFIVFKRTNQTMAEISVTLLRAYSNQIKVAVQLKEVDQDGKFKLDTVGFVSGYVGEYVVVADRKIRLADISNIRLVEM